MTALILQADDLLRGGDWATQSRRTKRTLVELLALVTIFGFVYGAVMGSYSGLTSVRFLQMFYSAVKVPILLLGTFALSLPSYFVINSLAGLRDDFLESLRALVATQAGLTIILASLSPFTSLWYASTIGYQEAVLFNAFLFAVASFAAQSLLKKFYGPLIARNPRHRTMLIAWLIVYAFVGIQMGWVLRPFIGHPNAPTHFFREHMWGNAYEVVVKMIWEVVWR